MAITGPKVPQWCWLQSEPFNWQKSLPLGKNANKVVGMWLCLKMRLFYLNSLTSFNPAIHVWGFSSGFPHTRGPAWAQSANEWLFRTSLCEARQNHEHFPDGISCNCASPGSTPGPWIFALLALSCGKRECSVWKWFWEKLKISLHIAQPFIIKDWFMSWI